MRHYTDADGLPQNSVKFIAGDNSGFIWLSTEDGLVRFDGVRFLRFGKDNIPVSSNRFQPLFPDETGRKLYSFNDAFEQVSLDNDGTVSITSKLQPWPQLKKKYAPFNSANLFADGLTYLSKATRRGMDKIFIAGNKDTIYQYDGNSLKVFKGDAPVREIPFVTSDDWKFFVVNQHLYLMRADGTATYFDGVPIGQRLSGDITRNPAYSNNRHKIAVLWNLTVPGAVIFYLNSSFYLATEVRPGLLTTKLLFSNFPAEQYNICAAYYHFKSGQLLLGSGTQGLFVLKPQHFTTITRNNAENNFYSQTVYEGNKIATPQSVAVEVSDTAIIPISIPRLAPENYSTMLTGSNGHIYTKKRNMLFEFESRTFRLIRQHDLPGDINVLAEGHDSAIWAGLRNGSVYRMSAGNISNPEQYGSLNELINYIVQADQNTLYIGTASGLYKVNKEKKWSKVAGMNGKHVRSIYVTGTDEIWITTYGDGLFLYRQGKLHTLPKDKGGFLTSAHCIVEDRNGFFWISTNKGLYKVAKSDLLNYAAGKASVVYYYYYDKTEGFNTNEFNGGCQPCAVRMANGLISLPSMDGLVMFRPDILEPILPAAGLFVDEILLDNKKMEPANLQKLPRQFGQLLLKISSPNHGHVNNLQISYAIVHKGEKEVWLPVNSDGTIQLTSLAPGDHLLRIRKINGFGLNNFTRLDLQIYVPPAWYQTLWFRIICGLLVIVAMIWIMRERTSYLNRQNTYLERAIALKTQELVAQTKVQDRIIRSVSHDIQTPLQFHEFLSKKLYATLLAEQHKSLLPVAKVLNESSYRLQHMVNNLLQFLKVQLNNSAYEHTLVDLSELITEKIAIFHEIARERGTTIESTVPIGLEVTTNRQLLSVVLHNLLDNAIKVTEHGKITIATRKDDERVTLSITDTGPGISEPLQQWLKTAGMEPVQEHAKSTGLGLLMIKELSQALGIVLDVIGKPGIGTEFRILFA